MGIKKEEFRQLLEEYTFHITEQDVFNWFKIKKKIST